jgi:membrane-bound serine protease (ClpP class)
MEKTYRGQGRLQTPSEAEISRLRPANRIQIQRRSILAAELSMRYAGFMRNWCLLILSLIALFGAPANLPSAETGTRRVFIIPIRDNIEPPLVYLVRRGVKEAMDAKADLIILDMKTNGGRVDVTEEIIDILKKFKGEIVTYVNDRAFSAGAFISVATQKIYMAPESVIGAAAPIIMSPNGGGVQDLPSTVEAKMNSGIRALVRREAQRNGYNIDVIEAMIDKNKELVIDGKTLNKKGDILTLTNTEAEQEYGNPPKRLLSSGTINSMDALLEELGYANAQRTVIQPTGAEKLGSWINAISPLLLMIGILGIYIEIKMPGTILPAVVAVIAFALYFLGGYIAGLSGMEWIIVFVIGLVLVLSELFLHPGTIIPGLVGFVLILVSLVMAMVDMYPGTPALPSLPQLKLPLENLTIALTCSLLLAAILARFLPKTPLFRALVSQGASGVTSSVNQELQQASRLGQTGVAISNLRPGGKAQFGEQILDVITQGEMISKGQPVRIIRHSGSEAVVELAG